MGRFITWLIMIPVAAAAIAFAVSNRTTAPLDLWPFPAVYEIPVFALVLGGMVAGFLLGGIVAWLSGGRTRRRARNAESRADHAERDLLHAKNQTRRVEDEARRDREAATAAGDGGAGVPSANPRDAA